jgi:GTPase SAR1 family protein
MPSLAIYGDSGMGKTMLMQRFCDDHPPLLDQRKGIERQQVLPIQLAGKPGERQLFAQILHAVGVSQGLRASSVDMQFTVVRLLKAIGSRFWSSTKFITFWRAPPASSASFSIRSGI